MINLNSHRVAPNEITLNGRVSGDSLGRPTFHSKSSVSVIDYAICDQDLLQHINYSTHRKLAVKLLKSQPIITWININTINQNRVAPIINIITSSKTIYLGK